MADNDNETLGLDIQIKGTQPAVSALKSIDAAANKVLSTTKAQTAANKTETSSLLDLEKAMVKRKRLLDDYNKDQPSKGGSPGGGGGDRVLGAAGRALGAVSPGAGSALRDLEDIKQFGSSLGDISKTAVVAGGALGVASLALAAVAARAEDIKNAAKLELDERAKVIAFIQTASKEEIATKLKEAQQSHATALAVANDANSVLELTRQGIKDQYGAVKAAFAELDPLYGEIGPTLAAAKEAAAAANKALDGDSTALSLLQQATEAGIGSEKSYKDAIAATTAERTKATLASADEALSLSKKISDEQKLNSKQIADRVDAIGAENRALQSAIDVIQLSGDTSADAAKKLTEYQVAQAKLGGELARLGDLKPVVMNIEAETHAREYANKQQLETIDIVKQYGSDVDALNGKLAENKTKLIDSLDEIFATAQKAAEDALAKLNQARDDILKDSGREEGKAARDAELSRIDILIKSQQQEVDIYKSYRRKLREIQKNADEQSFELALNRDFSGLFNLNRDTNIQKNNAGQEERDAIEDEETARARNLDDLQHSIEAEHAERAIALQQRFEDEVTAYRREREQIDAQRKDAEAKTRAQNAKDAQLLQQQLQTRQQSAQQELSLVQQTETQRLQIQQNANVAFLAQAQALLNALSAGNALTMNYTQNITSGADANQVADISKKATVKVVKQLIGVSS